MVERIDSQVRLNVKKAKGTDSLYVRNDLYAPVEIELRLSGVKNVVGVADQVIHRTIPARSNERLLALSPQVPGKAMAYKPSLRSIVGDPQRSISAGGFAYRYPLPWVGGPFRISQGPNGSYSHVGAKSRYAIDIAMPEGTQIIAARGGTVIKTENGQSGRGANPSGNFVRILHDDGTMGVYLHLKQGSVSVKEGERVTVGTPLGRSGNTGNSATWGWRWSRSPMSSLSRCRICRTSRLVGIEVRGSRAPRIRRESACWRMRSISNVVVE
jgi:murein DD-endopeptidase MepM/ murein hydrolase activator NlpD